MATKKLSSTTTVKTTTGPDGREITNTIIKPRTGGATVQGYRPYRIRDPSVEAVTAEVAEATKLDTEEATRRAIENEKAEQLSATMQDVRKAALDKPTPETHRSLTIKIMHRKRHEGWTLPQFLERAETGIDGLTITLQSNNLFLIDHEDLEPPEKRALKTLEEWWAAAG